MFHCTEDPAKLLLAQNRIVDDIDYNKVFPENTFYTSLGDLLEDVYQDVTDMEDRDKITSRAWELLTPPVLTSRDGSVTDQAIATYTTI